MNGLLRSGCCGIAEPHLHLCDLGPAGWLVRALIQWYRKR